MMGCIYFYAIVGIGSAVLGYALYTFMKEEKMRRKLERWKNTVKDQIILHAYPRGRTLPNASPYPLKLETYLRLAKLQYKHDSKDTFGPKGKTPWISLNGVHIGDSELIINYCNKKFEKDLNCNTDETTLANARIIRVMLEEFFMWAIGLERMVYGDMNSRFNKIMTGIPQLGLLVFQRTIKKRAYDQEIGRHTQAEVTEMMSKNLRSVSVALGNKKYFGGEDVCEEDCGIFGVLAQAAWGAPDSPYEKMMNDECNNLKEYCVRMKERVFPDWDELITH